jgi:hypothetical protein
MILKYGKTNLKKRMSDKRVRCVCGFLQEIGKYLRSRLKLHRLW